VSNNEHNVDVNRLINDVKQDISDRGLVNNDIPFSDVQCSMMFGTIFHSNKLTETINNLNTREDVTAYWSVKSKVKRLARRIMSFYIEPIVAQQNEVNKLLIKSITDLCLDNYTMERKINLLEEENKMLKSNKAIGADEELSQ